MYVSIIDLKVENIAAFEIAESDFIFQKFHLPRPTIIRFFKYFITGILWVTSI